MGLLEKVLILCEMPSEGLTAVVAEVGPVTITMEEALGEICVIKGRQTANPAMVLRIRLAAALEGQMQRTDLTDIRGKFIASCLIGWINQLT